MLTTNVVNNALLSNFDAEDSGDGWYEVSSTTYISYSEGFCGTNYNVIDSILTLGMTRWNVCITSQVARILLCKNTSQFNKTDTTQVPNPLR